MFIADLDGTTGRTAPEPEAGGFIVPTPVVWTELRRRSIFAMRGEISGASSDRTEVVIDVLGGSSLIFFFAADWSLYGTAG